MDQYQDNELIQELRARGYYVTKASHVRTLRIDRQFDPGWRDEVSDEESYLFYCRSSAEYSIFKEARPMVHHARIPGGMVSTLTVVET